MSLRTLTCAVVLCAGSALAGWQPITLNGNGRDVNAQAAGQVTFATTAEAVLKSCVADGGGCTDAFGPVGGAADTALWDPTGGCLLIASSTQSSLRGCSTNMFLGGTTGVRRVRRGGSGFTATHNSVNQATNRYGSAANPSASTYAQANTLGAAASGTIGLSVVSLGVVDYAVLDSSASTNAWFSVDGGAPVAIPMAPIPTAGDLQLFVRGDGGLGLIISEKVVTPRIQIGGLGPDAVWGGVLARNPSAAFISSLAYTELGGSPRGRGWGIGITLDGGMMSPIPNPDEPGMTWVHRSAPAVLNYVSCADPSFCAATATASSQAFIFWNEFAPDASIPALMPQTVGVPFTVLATAADPDDDPVWVSWERDGGGIFSVATSSDGGFGTAVQVTPLSCGTGLLTAYASDGYGPHDVATTAAFTIVGVPDQPSVGATPMSTQAGGAAVAITATAANTGCPATGLSFNVNTTLGGTFSPNGPTAFTYQPPPVLCAADGGDVIVAVTANGTPDASTPATITIHVDPWGVPSQPGFGAATVVHRAGFDAGYPLVGPQHACANAPVQTIWSVDGGAPGVTWRVDDGGIAIYSTEVCASGHVFATVTYDTAGQTSLPGTLDVDVQPFMQAVPDGGFSIGWMFDNAGTASGTFSVQGAGCLSDAGYLADVVIRDMNGVVVANSGPHDVVTMPGWSLPIPGSCDGGGFFAHGSLYGTPQTEDRFIFIGKIDAGVLAFDSDFDVTCEAGLVGQTTVSVPPGSCTAQVFTWQQLSGPPLTTFPVGNTLSFQSGDAGVDGLVGEALQWRVTAIAGPDNQASADFTMRLHHKFIALAHALGPQAAGADDLHTVRVHVTDTEPCGASAIAVHEVLDGLTPIAGSARLDGAAVDAGMVDGLFVIGPFPIDGLQTRELTYLARAPMFGRPSPTGIAKVKDEVVSMDAQLQPPPQRPACGCASGGSSLVALLALSFLPRLRALSRRRTSACSARRSRPW